MVIAGSIYLLFWYIRSLQDLVLQPGYSRTAFLIGLIGALGPLSIILFALALREKKNIDILVEKPADKEDI